MKLKRCPFCGIHEEWLECVDFHLSEEGETPMRLVNCHYCGAQGPVADNDKDAVKRWNKRTAKAEKIVDP